MGTFNEKLSAGTRAKQWLATLLLVIPILGYSIGILGIAPDIMSKLPNNCILHLLSALGFFLLWQIATNTATRTAAKITTILYALWTAYFAVMELFTIENLPSWVIHIISGAQIITPLILAYTASMIARNNRLGRWVRSAVWVVCAMCIVESYWSVANSALSLWIFDGMEAGNISIPTFKEIYRWFVIALNILSVFAFALICTSPAFNNRHDPNEPDPEYTPLNRFTIITVVVTLVLIAIS